MAELRTRAVLPSATEIEKLELGNSQLLEHIRTSVWSEQKRKFPTGNKNAIASMLQQRIISSAFFPRCKVPAVRTKAGLLSLALLAQINPSKKEFVQLRTQCRGLGNFGPDLPKLALDILRDPHNCIGSVPCSALIYETATITADELQESDSVLYNRKDHHGNATSHYDVARTLTPGVADLLLRLSEPRYSTNYKTPKGFGNLGNVDELVKVAMALSFIDQHPLLHLYTAIKYYQHTRKVPKRFGKVWNASLNKAQKFYWPARGKHGDKLKLHQTLFRDTLERLNNVQRVRMSTVFGDGCFQVSFCAFTGECEMVGEPANLIPVGALHNLNIKIREQQCHVDLMVAPAEENALWMKQDKPREIYTGHSRPYTRHSVKLFATLAAEKQVSLERPRALTIPDRMRAADSHTMFDTVRPWMEETPTPRDHLDTKYKQIALLAFPEGGRGAWTGKVDVDHESKKSQSEQKKLKPTTKLQNVALLKHPRNYGLHLLNFHVMKFAKDKRRGELLDIAPPYMQDLWYAKAVKWCKSFRHGKISQLVRDEKVMEDCAVIAVYVTYGVGLWLIDASWSDCQAWDDLKLHWHKQSLSTETDPKKLPNTNKQSDTYGTSSLRRKHPDAPTIDVRVTVADVSAQFVILMLKELVFPVCSVVDRI